MRRTEDRLRELRDEVQAGLADARAGNLIDGDQVFDRLENLCRA